MNTEVMRGGAARCGFCIGLALAWLGGGALAADPPKFTVDRPIDMKHIKLDLAVDLAKKHVDAVATLKMTPKQTSSSVVLDGVDLDVHSAKVDGKPARFSNTGKQIEVFFDPPARLGQDVTVGIDYAVSDPKDGLHFSPSPDDPDAPYLVWSQGESTENRYWIPSFDDPNERQTTEITATVDSKYVVVSNGKLVETKTVDGGKTAFHWVQDKPHPVYLVTLIVGEFAVQADTWRGKPVLYYAPPDRKDDIDRSFNLTPKMLDFFSDKIGVEYFWDKYAQTCCYQFGGGMENTSATTLGEGALHDARSAIDGVSDGLIAHELAHQWWGDLVTCKEWAHTWLNEGFATYFEALWDEHHEGADEFAYNMYNKSKSAISGGKALPIVHRSYSNAGEQFDSRAYPKGGWVLHMLRRRVGDELFWKSLNHYCKSHILQSVETSDLREAFEEVTGRSLERFFYDWTERPGNPVLDVGFKWDEATKLAEVSIKQTQETDAFVFPLTLEFRTKEGSAPTYLTREISEKQATVYLSLPSRPVMFVVDPADSLLKEISENKPRDLWQAQLAHENPVTRIRAAQVLAKDKNDANRAALAEAIKEERFWGVRSELAGLLADLGGDAARDALIDGAKNENPKARRACVEALGKFKDDSAAGDVLRKIVTDGDASYRVEAAAIEAYAKVRPAEASVAVREALKRDSAREVIRSAALQALGDVTDPAAIDLLTEWAAKSKPRECRTAATSSLADQALRLAADDPAAGKIVALLISTLDDGDRRVRDSAVRALGNLGKRSEGALPKLRELASATGSDRASRSAKGALEKIEKDEPAGKQFNDLKKQFDDMKAENRKLRDQIDGLEARMKADRPDRPQ